MIKLMNPLKSYGLQTKSVTMQTTMAAAYDTEGHMMPMGRPCVASDSKSGYVYMTKGQQCNEYILATIKNYLLLLYHVRIVKPFFISHIILRPLSRENLTLSHVNNKGTDQSAHLASLMGAFVICSLESIIAKQLNLAHSKLQASMEQADFSKMWSEILKKREAEHIEPAHYPNQTFTIQANRRHFRATCT